MPSYIIHGAASLRIGLGNYVNRTSTPSYLLGLSQDGIGVSEVEETVPIMTDVAGPSVQADEQLTGEMHFVTAVLTCVDLAVIDLMRRWRYSLGPRGRIGAQGPRGAVVNSRNLHFRLILGSQAEPRRYLCASWMNAREHKRGTVHSAYKFEFKCWSPMVPAPSVSSSVAFSGFTLGDIYDNNLEL
jgi:hypothetical protein